MHVVPDTHVVLLISNGYGPDVRVRKEAHTLALAGYRISVIAWDRKQEFPLHEIEYMPPDLAMALQNKIFQTNDTPQPVSIFRVQVLAGYQTGRRLLRQMPVFWWRALQELRRLQPDIVHAHDLDTLPLAYLYGQLANVPVIFDAREFYPGMVQANVGNRISRILDQLDHWLAPRVNAVITVGERLAARYRAMDARVWIVHNSQPGPDPDTIQRAGQELRQTFGIPDDNLLVVYAGMLNPDRLLTPLLEAVPNVEAVWLAVAGDGPSLAEVQAAVERCNRIKMLGWVPLDNVMKLVAASDIVYYGLNESNPNSFYFMPNLAFFALVVGRPLLVTPVGEIADVVQHEQCGITLVQPTQQAVETALRQLSDPSYRAMLANHALSLGQGKYNWTYAATQLLDVYEFCGCKKLSRNRAFLGRNSQ